MNDAEQLKFKLNLRRKVMVGVCVFAVLVFTSFATTIVIWVGYFLK
jgi:hypothetical protein